MTKVEISMPELKMVFTVLYVQVGSHHTVRVEDYAHTCVWAETIVAMEGDKNETVQFIKEHLAEIGLAMALVGRTFVSNGERYGFEFYHAQAGSPAHAEVWNKETSVGEETWIHCSKYFDPWRFDIPLSVRVKEGFESL